MEVCGIRPWQIFCLSLGKYYCSFQYFVWSVQPHLCQQYQITSRHCFSGYEDGHNQLTSTSLRKIAIIFSCLLSSVCYCCFLRERLWLCCIFLLNLFMTPKYTSILITIFIGRYSLSLQVVHLQKGSKPFYISLSFDFLFYRTKPECFAHAWSMDGTCTLCFLLQN